MTGFKGREVTLTWAAAAISGVQEKGLSFGGEPIDVSDDGSASWRELLTEPGERTLDISLSGVTKSVVLRAAYFSSTPSATVVVTYPTGGGSFTGTFRIASYSETGNYKEAVTFEAELQSTGAVVFTPPA